MDVSDEVDLNEIAANTVAAMAPWAVAQERAIILDGLDRQVVVTGNGQAIEDALRNLIENAILHAPPRTEVTVRVSLERSVSVVDEGPGSSSGDRELIFRAVLARQGSSVGRCRARALDRERDHECPPGKYQRGGKSERRNHFHASISRRAG
jgi:K+-sensing histidine kinase KdpD